MYIGIDLGGTSARAAAVDRNGRILRMLSEPCKAGGTQEEVLGQLCGLIQKIGTGDCEGIGFGVPSVVDTKEGVVYNVANIPSWKEVHLGEFMERKFSLPVRVDNDCNCFALGVCAFGEAKGSESAVCVTLGTGLGSSLLIGGRLFPGHNTGAGEIGSIPYLGSDYEHYCSSPFFKGTGMSGWEAGRRARLGDPEALALWREFGEHVGDLVKMILFAYDPEMIVFGGSISQAYPVFNESMYKVLSTFPYPKTVERIRIVVSELENAGILGAATLTMDR